MVEMADVGAQEPLTVEAGCRANWPQQETATKLMRTTILPSTWELEGIQRARTRCCTALAQDELKSPLLAVAVELDDLNYQWLWRGLARLEFYCTVW